MKKQIVFALSLAVLSITPLLPGCGGGSAAVVPPPPPALAITTASFPSGNVGTMYSAGIDSNSTTPNGGQIWSVSAGLPPGLTLVTQQGVTCDAGCGISGTPTTQGTFSFTVTVRDVNGATASRMFSITIGTPLPLNITTTSPLPDGNVNSAYTTTLGAAGGVPPFTWRLASGSSLPSNLALDTSGNISSGTLTLTTLGNFTFTVTVTDSETPAQTASATFGLTIRTVLFGQYAFLFHGFDANGAVVAAGSFMADGLGGITGGVEDVNRHASGPATNVAFSGSYTMGLDNRGTLTFTNSLGTSNFAFATDGSSARFIESDSTGTRGSGEMRSGSGAGPGLGNPGETIPYVFGMSGDDLNKGRVAVAGSFQTDGAGNLSGGALDQNDAGTLASNVAWTGTYTALAGSSRSTMTFTMAGAPTRNFALYASGGCCPNDRAFLVEVDTVASSIPLVAGTAVVVSPDGTAPAGALFTNASLSTPIVGGLTGLSVVAHAADVSMVFFSPDGKGNVAMTVDENNGGVVTTNTVLAGAYDVTPNGRVTLTAGTNPPVLYLASATKAFVVGTDKAATFGLLEPQISYGPLGTFSASINGNFHLGTDNPASAKVSDLSGVAPFDGAGTLSGTWDESGQAVNVTGTYSVTNTPVNGSGTLTVTAAGGQSANFVFLTLGADDCTHKHFNGRYTVCDSWAPPHATKLIAIPSDATQTNPAVLVLEQ